MYGDMDDLEVDRHIASKWRALQMHQGIDGTAETNVDKSDVHVDATTDADFNLCHEEQRLKVDQERGPGQEGNLVEEVETLIDFRDVVGNKLKSEGISSATQHKVTGRQR